MKRVEQIDYMRGLLALSVMAYHYLSWSFGTLGGEWLLGKLGIYAVSMFYIISGISLTIVYQDKFVDWAGIFSFALKRVFRIFPVYWLSISLMILFTFYNSSSFEPDIKIYFLNYTLLFGFLAPDKYLVAGGWSIGNEMVFYSLFPLFILSTRNKYLFLSLVLVSFCVYLSYAFVILDSSRSLSAQWGLYINPFNQLFLFVAGILIVKLFSSGNPGKRINLVILLACVGLFWVGPGAGDKIQLVTGVSRIFYTFICIMICLFIYMYRFNIWGGFKHILSRLGELSYSVYLLHYPVKSYLFEYFYPLAMKISLFQEKWLFYMFVCVPCTLILSYIVYYRLEVLWIRLGVRAARYLSEHKEKVMA